MSIIQVIGILIIFISYLAMWGLIIKSKNIVEVISKKKLTKLRDKLINGIESEIDEVILNGPRGDKRLPGNVSVCFRYVEGESILLNLDSKGIAASSGSACTSGSLDPSHVLLALGLSSEVAHGSVRLSLGLNNNEEQVDYFLEVMPEIIDKLREMSALYEK